MGQLKVVLSKQASAISLDAGLCCALRQRERWTKVTEAGSLRLAPRDIKSIGSPLPSSIETPTHTTHPLLNMQANWLDVALSMQGCKTSKDNSALARDQRSQCPPSSHLMSS